MATRPSRTAREIGEIAQSVLWTVLFGAGAVGFALSPAWFFAPLLGFGFLTGLLAVYRDTTTAIDRKDDAYIIYFRDHQIRFTANDITSIRIAHTQWYSYGTPSHEEKAYKIRLSSGVVVVLANSWYGGSELSVLLHKGPVVFGEKALAIGSQLLEAHIRFQVVADFAVLKAGHTLSYRYQKSSTISVDQQSLTIGATSTPARNLICIFVESGEIVLTAKTPVWPRRFWGQLSTIRLPVRDIDDALIFFAVAEEAIASAGN